MIPHHWHITSWTPIRINQGSGPPSLISLYSDMQYKDNALNNQKIVRMVRNPGWSHLGSKTLRAVVQAAMSLREVPLQVIQPLDQARSLCSYCDRPTPLTAHRVKYTPGIPHGSSYWLRSVPRQRRASLLLRITA